MRKRDFPHHSYTTLPKNYTKAYGPCTLSLNADHEAGSGLPIFSNGAVISGSLEISKISKLLQSIQIMVRIQTGVPVRVGPCLTLPFQITGRIIIQDLGGAGTSESIMFSHVFYEWSREYNSSLPPTLVPLSYPLPSKYTDRSTGLEHQMPPTYKARLNTAVPGLRVKVQYDLSAKIVRSRRKIPFLTKTTRSVYRLHTLKPTALPFRGPLFHLFPPHLLDRRLVTSGDRLALMLLCFDFFKAPRAVYLPPEATIARPCPVAFEPQVQAGN